jgi:CBS domain-containing protein
MQSNHPENDELAREQLVRNKLAELPIALPENPAANLFRLRLRRCELNSEFFEGGAALGKTAGEAMNAHPKTITALELAAKALAILEDCKITSLIVVDAAHRVEGVVHLHDLWGVELI